MKKRERIGEEVRKVSGWNESESKASRKDLCSFQGVKKPKRARASKGETQPHKVSGDNSLRDPPVPIPNTEVKPQHADGTWRATARKSRSSPDSMGHIKRCVLYFYAEEFEKWSIPPICDTLQAVPHGGIVIYIEKEGNLLYMIIQEIYVPNMNKRGMIWKS